MRWRICRRRRKPEISFLIPFRASKGSDRRQILDWIRRYWKYELPNAEIIIGKDNHRPFSKTSAVNDAARRAKGKIFVILDADAYFDGELILESVRRIREAQEQGRHLWFIPYRYLYRLTREATELVLESNPRHSHHFPHPLPPRDIEHTHHPHYGHHYAAMVMVMPREAFWLVGGFDERFQGWGGEDVAMMYALDTLYGPHRTIKARILHLHHHRIGGSWNTTMWEDQETPLSNQKLAMRYNRAHRDKKMMAMLISENKNNEIFP